MVGDIKDTLDAVGFDAVENPDVVVEALVVSADPAPAFHVKVLPFNIVATNTCPKLSSDHKPGSNVTSDAAAASPQLPSPHVPIPQP